MEKRDRVTFSSIAKEIGVTTSVVSRVMNNNSSTISIGKTTKRRVLDAAWEKGFFLNRNIGLMVPERVSKADFIYYPSLAGIIHESMKLDYGILNLSYDDSKPFTEIPDFLSKRKVSGMLFLDTVPESVRGHLVDEKIPYVVMNPSSGSTENDSIVFNDYDAMTELLEYLEKKGYEDYVYISYDSSTTYSGNVIRSFNDFSGSGTITKTVILSTPSKEESALQELSKRIRNAGRNTVFITPARLFTIKLMALLEANGKYCPDDVGIVGSSLLAEYCIPRLTTVEYPFFEMGSLAVEMLRQKQVSRQYNLDSIVVKAKIIMNQSTGGKA